MAGAPSLAGCTNCAAWFHYDDGSKDGTWVLGLVGGCDDIRSASAPYAPANPTPVTFFAFPFAPVNPTAQSIWIGYNEFRTPPTLEALADALYYEQQTRLVDGGPSADDYAIVCADGAGSPGGCPPGSYWDNASETCKPVTGFIRPIIVPPPAPAPRPTPMPGPTPPPIIIPPPALNPCPEIIPCPPGSDPESDELGTCCQVTATYLYFIAKNLEQLAQGQGGAPADSCCLEIVLQLRTLAMSAVTLVNKLSSAAPPPATIVTVNAPVTVNVPSQPPPEVTLNAPPTNLQPVVDALDRYTKIIDIKPAVIQFLVDQGFIDGGAAQVVQSADTGDWILAAFRTAGFVALKWYLGLFGYQWDGKQFIDPKTGFGVFKGLEQVASTALAATDSALTQPVKDAVASLSKILTPSRVGRIGEQIVDPDAFLTRSVSIVLSAWLANYVGHLADIVPGESAAHLVESLTGLVGLEELRDVQIGPLVQYGPARIAEMKAKALYRQELPGIGTLADLAARGLLSRDDYNSIALLTGVPPQIEGAIEQAAYSGLNPRILMRLVDTGLFTSADITDELTFSGLRPTSQKRLLLAAPYLATAPQRQLLRSAIEAAYDAGVISDNDLTSRLESAEHNTDRDSLILEAVKLKKQVALAKEYEAAYSREFLAGLLDPPGYQAALEGLNMQPPDVAARMFRDETHLLSTQTLSDARQARAVQRATASAERKTAVETYRTGATDEAGLAAALLLTGLTPTQVAAQVSYQTLAKSGVLRWIYGRQLPPLEATLLRQRVADLTRQREILQLTDVQYVSQLKALNIPDLYVNALQAGANAHISPKTAAILTPVATS